MKRVLLFNALIVFLILLCASLPILSVATASTIANANGCRLDEGSPHPCLVGGRDVGETLYTLGVLGWLMLFTIPAGLLLLAIDLLVVGLFVWVKWLQRKRSGQSAPE